MNDSSPSPMSAAEFLAQVERRKTEVPIHRAQWYHERDVTFSRTARGLGRMHEALLGFHRQLHGEEPGTALDAVKETNPVTRFDDTWGHYTIEHFRKMKPWLYNKSEYVDFVALILGTMEDIARLFPCEHTTRMLFLTQSLTRRWLRLHRHPEWTAAQEEQVWQEYWQFSRTSEDEFDACLCSFSEYLRCLRDAPSHRSATQLVEATYANTTTLLERTPPPKPAKRQDVVNLVNAIYTEHHQKLSIREVVLFIRRDVTEVSSRYGQCLAARVIVQQLVAAHTGKGRVSEDQIWRSIAKDAQPSRFLKKPSADTAAAPGPVSIPDRGWGSSRAD